MEYQVTPLDNTPSYATYHAGQGTDFVLAKAIWPVGPLNRRVYHNAVYQAQWWKVTKYINSTTVFKYSYYIHDFYATVGFFNTFKRECCSFFAD